MSEFVVWDKSNMEFFTTPYYTINSKGNLVDHMGLKVNSKEYFNYIGLKDINNKKIYADSSIVEFKYDGEMLRAFFWYSKIELLYILRCFVGIKNGYRELNPQIPMKFKIIDTIQENKRGLIKWSIPHNTFLG